MVMPRENRRTSETIDIANFLFKGFLKKETILQLVTGVSKEDRACRNNPFVDFRAVKRQYVAVRNHQGFRKTEVLRLCVVPFARLKISRTIAIASDVGRFWVWHVLPVQLGCCLPCVFVRAAESALPMIFLSVCQRHLQMRPHPLYRRGNVVA